MKILHVITRMVHGGAQLNTLMCAAEQARQGHEVTLATGPETGSEGSLLDRVSVRMVVLPHLRRDLGLADLRGFWELYRLMGEGFDLVHTHTSKAGFLGRWAAFLRRVPLVVHTPHGHVFQGYFGRSAERLFIWLERLTALITHRLVMLTSGELNDHLAERIAPRSKFVVIPSGVDVESFACSGRVRGQRLGSVLRLVEVKGVFDLIEAFGQVCRRFPGCELHLAGDGPCRAELQRRIGSLPVVLHGHVDDVAGFLRTLDLFVLPSHNEGMGRAVVEAMASGLPIVATRVSGLPDLVQEGENGCLVPVRRPDLLAACLEKVLSDPSGMDRMGQASRSRAHAFSSRVMYERLERLYAGIPLGHSKA